MSQLYLRDVPLLRPPGHADLLQVLWCPYDNGPEYKPSTALLWRSAAAVVGILATPPEPHEVHCEGYVPEPCTLALEAITEYPDSLDLRPQIRLMLEGRSRWEAARPRPGRPGTSLTKGKWTVLAALPVQPSAPRGSWRS
ncbi:hypothetical protein ACFW47_20805 [Streptomyces sp. NPDC058796]|uniref:hypothetical protein n=1 Tax=unclassified Streptomyces TaxID=2593676 RepID=UPI0036A86DFC